MDPKGKQTVMVIIASSKRRIRVSQTYMVEKGRLLTRRCQGLPWVQAV